MSNVATIADVARLAGVSPMTVSRVVNGEKNVRPSTRSTVNAAIAALNYVPNQAARRLVGADIIRIGVLHANPGGSYLSAFLVGLMNQASRSHIHVVLERCDNSEREVQEAQKLIDNGLDGLVLPPPMCESLPILELMARTSTPAVAVASGQPQAHVCAVRIDDYQAAHDMTRHLLALGHERIGFVMGNPQQTASSLRLAGYRAAISEANLPVLDELVAPGMFSYRSGLDAAELLLGKDQRPTALFASNDDMAAAAVAVAHRMGLDVPGDLTVVGFDDTAIATTIWPELTTIHQPVAAMAEAAVALLTQHIIARRRGDAGPPEHLVMGHALVRRQSDAAPRLRPPIRIAS